MLTPIWGSLSLEVSAAETITEEEKLYYGYNVTSGINLAEPDALSTVAPIIDKESDYLSHVAINHATRQTSKAYTESSLSKLSSEFARDIGANVFGRIYEVDVDIASAFDLSQKTGSVYAEQYELYTTTIVRYYYIVQLDLEQIRNYLSKEFVEELYSVDSEEGAKALFEKYGTHLNTGYTFGGRLDITNYKNSTDTNQDFSQSMSLSEKMSTVIALISAGENASLVEQYDSIENDSTSKSTYSFVSYGGDATSGLTLDGLFTYNPSLADGDKAGFMYTRWINSINEDRNLAILGVPSGAKSIPVWDLLDNSSENDKIRDYLINAYIDLCGDKYDTYLSQWPDTIQELPREDVDSGLPRLRGAYVETVNGFYYYVDRNAFLKDGDHNLVQKGDYLYLDLEAFSDLGETTYSVQNGETIDSNNAIFRVTGTSGVFEIKASVGNNTASIINLPIKETGFEGGSGTEDYPFIITNAEQFKRISSNTSAHYLLVQDIDFQGSALSPFKNFTGVLDGNYCLISNFTISSAEEWGLFSKNSGTIRNLHIENAGSSTSRGSFGEGGLEYYTDFYDLNSIQSSKAGVICGENTGTIENCYLINVFVRNIISNPDEFITNETISLRTGAVTGVNSGVIKNCMVSNSNILGSFVSEGDKNEDNIFVYTGGLIGELLSGGSIVNTVVDSGINGSVFSQSVNPYKFSANATDEVFATMFVGYCNANAMIENSYVYVRNTMGDSSRKAVDVEMVFDSTLKYKPDNYHALRGAYIICGENCDIVGSNVNAYSDDEGIKYYALSPTKNGMNNDGTNKAFDKSDKAKIDKYRIDGEAAINTIGLPNEIFSYDINALSRIKHILSGDRRKYMRIDLDETERQMRTKYYVNEFFTPVGLKPLMYIGSDNIEIKVFCISVQGLDQSAKKTKLTSRQNNAYSVVVSPYGDNTLVKRIPLSIDDNAISKIYIDNSEEYYTFYDNIHDYYSDFSLQSVKAMAVLTGGDIIDISNSPEMLGDTKISIITPESNIVVGDNLITIKCEYNKEVFDASFVLHVEKRNIEEVVILQEPDKTMYQVGEIVKLDGMKVELKYNVGESRYLQTNEELKQLEVTGTTVGLGQNTVAISFDRYSNAAYFIVTGIPKSSDLTDNSQEDSQIEYSEAVSESEIIEQSEEESHLESILINDEKDAESTDDTGVTSSLEDGQFESEQIESEETSSSDDEEHASSAGVWVGIGAICICALGVCVFVIRKQMSKNMSGTKEK